MVEYVCCFYMMIVMCGMIRLYIAHTYHLCCFYMMIVMCGMISLYIEHTSPRMLFLHVIYVGDVLILNTFTLLYYV